MKQFLTISTVFTLLLLSSELFAPTLLRAQTVEELENTLENLHECPEKVDIWLKLAQKYYRNKPQKTQEYSDKALSLARNLGYQTGIAQSYKVMGIARFVQSKYDEAIQYFERSVKMYEIIQNQEEIANNYNNIGIMHQRKGDFRTALKYQLKALKTQQNLGDSSGVASSYNNVGLTYQYLGEYDKSIEYYLSSLRIKESLNDRAGIAKTYNNLGIVARKLNNQNQALEYYQKYLAIERELGDQKGIANALGNIGTIYKNRGDYEQALQNHLEALKIKQQIGNQYDIAITYGNIADLYEIQGQYALALNYHQQSLQIKEEIGDKRGIAITNYSLGVCWQQQKKLDSAKIYLEKALDISQTIEEKEISLNSAVRLSELYEDLGQPQKALQYFKTYNRLNQSLISEDKNKQIVEMQTKYESEKKQQENELLRRDNALKQAQIEKQLLAEQQQLFEAEKREQENQILRQENALKAATISEQKLREKQSRIEEAKRKAEIVLLQKEQQVQEEQIKRKNQEIRQEKALRNYFLIILVLVFAIALLLYRNNRQKQKSNRLLQAQKEEISQQRDNIEQQHSELQQQAEEIRSQRDALETAFDEINQQNVNITASITYAERIQAAILPLKEQIQTVFPESFVLYRPRDIVSGDFYWFSPVKSPEGVEKFVLAVIDCTGHGVPGAFMSMLGNAFLNQIVNVQGIMQTDKILEALNLSIRRALKQEQGENNDGMDLTLCIYTPSEKTLEFSGAKNSLYLAKRNQIIEVKGSKYPVGGIQFGDTPHYERHTFRIEESTMAYMCSDGYQDQFGGARGKKFMRHNLRNLLKDIQQLPAQEQAQTLERTLDDWMQYQRQIDDILVLGFRIG